MSVQVFAKSWSCVNRIMQLLLSWSRLHFTIVLSFFCAIKIRVPSISTLETAPLVSSTNTGTDINWSTWVCTNQSGGSIGKQSNASKELEYWELDLYKNWFLIPILRCGMCEYKSIAHWIICYNIWLKFLKYWFPFYNLNGAVIPYKQGFQHLLDFISLIHLL